MKDCNRMPPYHGFGGLSSSPRRGSQTPWGIADDAKSIGVGVISATTPSHGGIWLSPFANRMIPPQYRRADQWYEEDCEAVIALAFTRNLITDPHAREFCNGNLEACLAIMFPTISRYIQEHPECLNVPSLDPDHAAPFDPVMFEQFR